MVRFQVRGPPSAPRPHSQRSFPKAKDASGAFIKPGVRSPEAIRETLVALATTTSTGQYVHADEWDAVQAEGGDPMDSLKPINEPPFPRGR